MCLKVFLKKSLNFIFYFISKLIDKVALANDAPYAEILTPVLGDGDAAMLEVGFDTYSEQLMPHHLYPGWQSAARVRLASSRFVLLNAFVDHMRAYFVDGPIMSALLAATAEQARARAAQAARAVAADPVPASRMKLDLKLSSFFVEVRIFISCFLLKNETELFFFSRFLKLRAVKTKFLLIVVK